LPEGSIILSAKERQAFSLWYMRFVEDTGRDFAPVAVPLLQFDWYWRSISQQFPDMFQGDAPDDHTQTIRRIVEHNGESKVFFTYPDHFLERSFELERTGKLFRASPSVTQ
jgi:hypothetical protein